VTSWTSHPIATTATGEPLPPTAGLRLEKVRTITATGETGPLSPKAIVASGTGVLYAQNMIYNHSVTAFDADGEFLATIPDAVDLARFGVTGFPAGTVQGGPVELAFSPDGRYVLVTNWCTYDRSVIDVATGREVQRLPMGEYPRGVAVSPDSRTAYVAIMGGREVKVVDLASFTVGTLADVGRGPAPHRHQSRRRLLYVTLNKDGLLAKVDARTGAVVAEVATDSAPRSMDISADGHSRYVVNYESLTVSKVTTADMAEVQELATAHHPIGVTYDRGTGRVWVASYGGEIEIFEDR